MAGFIREDAAFYSEGTICRAWFYRPESNTLDQRPCIVMAHGLGGTRDAGLEPYAELFAESGFCVLLFDYRHLGSSDGEPRQLISVKSQLEDWQAAVSYARRIRHVNPVRVALWGSSFSGGHVMVTAARDHAIAAFSAQCPMMDGLTASLNVLRYAGAVALARISALGVADEIGSRLGRKPIYIPLVAAPGQIGAMTTPDAEPGYRRLTPASWNNQMAARLVPVFSTYRPIKEAQNVKCPALIQVCNRDTVAPPDAAFATAEAIQGPVELKTYDMGHFDIYIDAGFRQSSQDQLEFFNRVLMNR